MIDKQEISRLAGLSKLKLSAEEVATYGQQLEGMLSHLVSLGEAEQFLQQAQLIDQVDNYQSPVVTVDAMVDEVIAWPADEVATSLGLANSQPGQPMMMPPIRE